MRPRLADGAGAENRGMSAARFEAAPNLVLQRENLLLAVGVR